MQRDIERVLLSRDEVRDYYNKIARVYDVLAERSERPMRELGLSLLDARPGEHVMEVGCGTGHSVVALAKAVGAGGKAYGVDLSENMVDITRALADDEGVGDHVEVHRADATELPIEDASLDGLFMSFTLELFDTPEIPVVLAEAGRVLKPGGRIAVVAISKEKPDDVMVAAYEWTHRHFPNLLDCRPIHVRQALEDGGLDVRQAEVRRMWVPVEVVLAVKPS